MDEEKKGWERITTTIMLEMHTMDEEKIEWERITTTITLDMLVAHNAILSSNNILAMTEIVFGL